MKLCKDKKLLLYYIERDIQKLFNPFYLLEHIFLMTKFRVRDNFVYPHGPKLKTAMSMSWTIILILCVYNIFTRYGQVSHLLKTKTQLFLVFFYLFYNTLSILVVFILNVMHDYKNVLLILNIQMIHKRIKTNRKSHKYNIVWNWISSVAIICINILLLACCTKVATSFDYVDLFVIFFYINIDFNIMYATRIITMLNIYLFNFNNYYLLTDQQEEEFENFFKIYQTIMKAYNLFNKVFNFLVIYCFVIHNYLNFYIQE